MTGSGAFPAGEWGARNCAFSAIGAAEDAARPQGVASFAAELV
ncbi:MULTISPECIES: hypothetical protein [unclassified Paenibacillus]|nr:MULTISPECIES: hypothetical protein [unclassified Paenibacillus]EGL19286.1 hypothetical protein HMPREF9413_1408 [Paenibacillus sp. HGF7]